MDNKNQDTEQIEAQIRALFAQCEIPVKGSNSRIVSILKKGLYELSLRDLIQFATRITQTMFLLGAGPKKTLIANGDKK